MFFSGARKEISWKSSWSRAKEGRGERSTEETARGKTQEEKEEERERRKDTGDGILCQAQAVPRDRRGFCIGIDDCNTFSCAPEQLNNNELYSCSTFSITCYIVP